MKKVEVYPVTAMLYMLLVLGCLAFVFATTGCAGKDGDPGAPGPVQPYPPFLYAPATSAECPYGGTVMSIEEQVIKVCNGAPGAQGIQGLPGLVGPTGPAGLSGQNGTDASIGVLNLCPGAPSYPNVFVEVALCINGDLYGVYSANGGFMTYLPPGQYTSNGIGAACNLTIATNCVVTH